MNGLYDLQHQFQNYLLNTDPEFKSCINGTLKVPVDVRLAIYSNAYRLRLIDALAANYPILEKCLGCEQFNELGQSYLKKYPSTFRSIRWFGDKLPQFLNDEMPYRDMPYLAEIAQFEWAMTLVFEASDTAILQMEDVSVIPPESWPDIQFCVHASLHRLNLKWNTVQIWQAVNEDKQPPEPMQLSASIPWVLWRKELVNQFCSMPEDEAWAMDAVLQGFTFGDMCEGLCQWIDEENAGLRAASLLKGWIQSGLLSAIKT